MPGWTGERLDVPYAISVLHPLAAAPREPAIASYALKMQAANIERFTEILATHAGVDPVGDLRPRLVVAAAFAAVNGAWNAYMATGGEADIHALVDEAFDIVDAGMARALPGSR